MTTLQKLPRTDMQRRLLGLAALVAIAWALATLPVTWAALATGAVAAGLLLIRWPWLVWAGVGLALPVASSVKVGAISATELLLMLAIGLWLADGARRHSLRLPWTPLLWPLLLYAGILYLSLFFAADLGEAAAEVVKWVEFAIIVLLVRAMCGREHVRWLVAAMLAGAMLQALLGIYQFVNRIGPEWFVILDRFMRASGSFRQPNPYAGYLGLSLPVAVSLAIYGWSRITAVADRRPGDTLWALYYSAAAGLIGLGLLASWSRGGWLGALVGVGAVLILRSRRAAILSLVVGLLLLAGLLLGALQPELVPTPVAERVQDIPAYLGLTDVLDQPLTDENFAVQERLAHWVAALRMWERSPWMGIGAGNYAVVYPEVRLPFWEEPLGHAHNIYLNHLAETGLTGLLAYAFLWVWFAVWVWRRLRSAGQASAVDEFSGWQAALAVGVLGALAHLAVHNFFDNLFVQGIYVQIALWMALLTIDAPSQNMSKRIVAEPVR